MMTAPLSPPFRRALAVTILLGVVFTVYTCVIAPLWGGYAEDRQTVEQFQDAQTRYEQVGREAPQLQKQIEALRRSGPAAAGYLEGQSEPLVAASLQDRLKTVVQQSGGQLKSTQVITAADSTKSRRIAVRGQMQLSLAALQRVLYELESGSPFLFLDNLEIRPMANPRGAAPSADDGEGLLDVHFDVYGYMRGAA